MGGKKQTRSCWGKSRTENDNVSSHAKQSFSFEVHSGERCRKSDSEMEEFVFRVSSPSGIVDVSPFC